MATVKRFLVWVFTDALSVHVGATTYVPDWNAVAAIAGAVTALIGLAAVWYSIRALRYQLRHQTELEAKQLERELLLRVMDLAQVPYEASKSHVVDIMTWSFGGGPTKNPAFFSAASARVSEEHRKLSTATAAVLHVVRRSRLRRFPRGTKDHAFERYYELVQRTLAANAQMLLYGTRNPSEFDIVAFDRNEGAGGFSVADLLRRFTGELLARMYSLDQEWAPIVFAAVGPPNTDGHVPLNFVDDVPLGAH
jgi:hypothetical protein